MILTGTVDNPVYSDSDHSFALYIIDPSGARTDVFSGDWGQKYEGRFTLPNPQLGSYVYGRTDSWRDKKTKVIVSSNYETPFQLTALFGGNLDENYSLKTKPQLSQSSGGALGMTVTPTGSLTITGLNYDTTAQSPLFELSTQGGSISVSDCKYINLALNNGTGTVNLSNCQLDQLGLNGAENVTINHVAFDCNYTVPCDFGSLAPFGGDYYLRLNGKNLTVTNCAFGMGFYTNSFAPEESGLIGLIFANNDVYGDCQYIAGSDLHITGNTFHQTLRVFSSGNSTFIDNSVYGRGTQFDSGISINGNYWGGNLGPGNQATAEAPGWLHPYGAIAGVSGGLNANLTYNGSGKASATDLKPLKVISPELLWIEGRRIGQNALTSDGTLVRKGRPILFCFDLRTAESSLDLSNAHFTLNVTADGNKLVLQPTGSGLKTAYRDYMGHCGNDGTRTLNFELPASNATNISYELVCDVSNLTQFHNSPALFPLGSGGLTQKPYFARPLRIGVVAISIPGEAPMNALAVKNQVDRLKNDLTSLWPLTESEVDVQSLGEIDYDGSLFGKWITFATTTGLTNNLANTLLVFLNEYNSTVNPPSSNPLDLLVGVVPGGLLGSGNLGLNMSLRRSVCLVDVNSPSAAIHELGHGVAGLWTGFYEEYDQSEGLHDGYKFESDMGALMRDTVAYNPSSVLTNGISGGQFVLFPQAENLATRKYYDFMGAGDPFWILPQSLSGVYDALTGLLGTANTPLIQSGVKMNSAARVAGVGGLSRFLISGILQWDIASSTYLLNPGSFRISCVNGLGMNAIPTSGPTGGGIDAISASGLWLGAMSINLGWSNNYRGDSIPWSQTMDFSDAYAGYYMPAEYQAFSVPSYQSLGDYKIRSKLTNNLSAAVVSGTGGDPDVVHLNWTCSGAVTGTTGVVMPLTHSLQYSADNGATWKFLTSPQAGNQFDLPAFMFPSAKPLVFRLLTSDGFIAVSSTAGIPSVEAFKDKQGVVTISEPYPGNNGPTGSLWRLAASVTGTATQVQWSSDFDGVLGVGVVMENVALSSGTHVITCIATFAPSVTSTANVSVAVGVPPDLQLRAGDLKFRPTGLDPTYGNTSWQTSGTNNISLDVHNTGTAGYWKCRIYITPPGGTETLLREEAMMLAAFQGHTTNVSYTPSAHGAFIIRAEVLPDSTSISIPEDAPPTTDAQLSNNTLVITTGNDAPIAQPEWVNVTADTPTSFSLYGRDPNGDTLTYNVTTQPAHGNLSGVPPSLIYTPTAGYQGGDKLSFTVSDGLATSVPKTVTFLVANYHPPTAGELSCVLAPAPVTVVQGASAQTSIFSYPLATSLNGINLPPGLSVGADNASFTGTATTVGDYTVTLSANNEYGTGPSCNLVIHVVPPSGYNAWVINHPDLPPLATGPSDDPDHDGIPNITECAMGLNPVHNDKQYPCIQSFYTSSTTGKKWGRIHMPWSPTAADNMTWWAECSADLKTWVKINPALGTGNFGYGTYMTELDGLTYPNNPSTSVLGARAELQPGKPMFLRFVFLLK